MKDCPESLKGIEGHLKELAKCRKQFDNLSQTSYLSKQLQWYLNDDDFANKLDQLENKLAFKNGILDLVTMDFTKGICPEHFVSRVIDFDYDISNIKEDKETVDKEEKIVLCQI